MFPRKGPYLLVQEVRTHLRAARANVWFCGFYFVFKSKASPRKGLHLLVQEVRTVPWSSLKCCVFVIKHRVVGPTNGQHR
jgi:hypothetical protein